MSKPKEARSKILKILRRCLGNMSLAAFELGCNYYTMLRIIQGDRLLKAAVLALRKKLAKQGISQRGWSDWHRQRMK